MLDFKSVNNRCECFDEYECVIIYKKSCFVSMQHFAVLMTVCFEVGVKLLVDENSINWDLTKNNKKKNMGALSISHHANFLNQ